MESFPTDPGQGPGPTAGAGGGPVADPPDWTPGPTVEGPSAVAGPSAAAGPAGAPPGWPGHPGPTFPGGEHGFVTPEGRPSARRPSALELLAALLLAAAFVLHVVALFPHYFGGTAAASLWSQSDQAPAYAILAAGWALALGIGLSSPARVPASAAFAVGLALTELGFRQVDLGQVFSGQTRAASGLYLMTVGWAVGFVAAIVAVVAARQERRRAGTVREGAPVVSPTPPGMVGGWQEASVPPPAGSPEVAAQCAGPADPDLTGPIVADATTDMDVPPRSFDGDTAILATAGAPASAPAAGPQAGGDGPPTSVLSTRPDGPRFRPAVGPLVVVGLLSLAIAGAFLPAWDHYRGVASSGQAVSFNLGNAFSEPWQIITGNVVAALAIALVPIGAYLQRNRGLAAAAVSGMLVVLSGQFVVAVIQIGQSVPASVTGLDPNLTWHQSLTGWFTLDILLAYALFAVVMVLGHLRTVEAHDSSGGTVPSTPDSRNVASLPWS